jgi:hypothetical protein
MLAGVSTRRYARAGEPVGSEIDAVARSTSKSAVSREFVSRTREHLIELMSRPLGDLRLVALMLDGIELRVAAASSRSARHRRRQAPARAVGRLDGERDGGDHAAGQPGRARTQSRACSS